MCVLTTIEHGDRAHHFRLTESFANRNITCLLFSSFPFIVFANWILCWNAISQHIFMCRNDFGAFYSTENNNLVVFFLPDIPSVYQTSPHKHTTHNHNLNPSWMSFSFQFQVRFDCVLLFFFIFFRSLSHSFTVDWIFVICS